MADGLGVAADVVTGVAADVVAVAGVVSDAHGLFKSRRSIFFERNELSSDYQIYQNPTPADRPAERMKKYMNERKKIVSKSLLAIRKI